MLEYAMFIAIECGPSPELEWIIAGVKEALVALLVLVALANNLSAIDKQLLVPRPSTISDVILNLRPSSPVVS